MEIASMLLKTADLVLLILGSPIVKEIKSISNYETEFKMLADTVEFIGDVLSEVEAKQFKEASVIKGYKRLREAFLDAEDFLDRVETLRKMRKAHDNKLQKTRRFFSKSNPAKYAIEVHDAIKKIRKNLDVIVQDLQKFGLKEACIISEETLTAARATGSFVDATRIIGREEDKRKIVELLSRSSFAHQKIPVISIVGMGGMGKTTLAQFIYDDEGWQESGRFIMKSWVSDSKKLDLKSLLRNILKSFSPNDARILDNLEEDHLKDWLVKEIRGKSLLLVLDDVEDEDPWNWEKLEGLLNCGNQEKSRIVVTTRSRRVADVVGSSDLTYVLKGLEERDSFDLFKRYAFRGSIDASLIEIGINIVDKCNGVPLAIKVIGSYLRDKVRSKWERVSYHGLERDKNPVISILKTSYYGLESTLRQCFSLCALFPKNYSIRKEILTGIWMVHVRFAIQRHGTLQEVCDDVLEILCERFFLEKETSGYRFKMHDLMYDLATEIGEERILVMDSKAKLKQYESISEKVRHVSLDHRLLEDDEVSTFELKGRRLRTLLCIENSYQKKLCIENPYWYNYDPWIRMILGVDKLEASFPFLRLLDLHASGIKNLTCSVGKLIHLRHLDLSRNEFQILPSSFSELINLRYLNLANCKALAQMTFRIDALTSLEELDLCGCEKLEQLPTGIEKLVSLRRFRLAVCQALTQMSFGMDALIALEELDLFGCKKLEQLPTGIEKLVSLRRFTLAGCGSLTRMPFRMDALTALQEFDVSGCERLEQLPMGIGKLVISLTKFDISLCNALTEMPSGVGALLHISTPSRIIIGHPETKHAAQLEELRILSKTKQGKLRIELPSNIVVKVPGESESYLLNKDWLRKLEIKWQEKREEDDVEPRNHMDVLGKLQPHPNLEEFRLDGYQGMTFPPWMPKEDFASLLPNLTRLEIWGCGKCRRLPPLSTLRCLRRLMVCFSSSLEYIEEENNVSFCPSLELLRLDGLPKLMGWSKSSMLPSFPSLNSLRINSCRELSVEPILLSFVKVFASTTTSSVSLFVQVCRDGGSFDIDLWEHNHDLVYLTFNISGLNAGGSRTSVLLDDAFRGMSDRMTHLKLNCCSGFKTFPRGLQHLNALQRLCIMNCCDFTGEEDNGEMSCALQSLTDLTLERLPKMIKLPQWIQLLTSLRRVSIRDCTNLTLPEWVHDNFYHHTYPFQNDSFILEKRIAGLGHVKRTAGRAGLRWPWLHLDSLSFLRH